MTFNRLLTDVSLLLWIFLLHLTRETSCASLRNYSLTSISVVHRDSDLEKISELIEFSPINLPEEVENTTITHHEFKKTTPKAVTYKLKTNIIVQNQNSSDSPVGGDDNLASILSLNVSESSLSDIEYEDPTGDLEFWRWNTKDRKTRTLDYPEDESTSGEIRNSSEELIPEQPGTLYESEDSEENKISRPIHRSKYASGRQFVFHPYLPYGKNIYGKDTTPDEKIIFDDILPVKMVKFIKSMVEEAPWEQMFMKMVRMIVDQFVDKIIEKMFEDKKHDIFKKRSVEVLLSPTFLLPTLKTPVIRLRRAVGTKQISPDQDEDMFNFFKPTKTEQDTATEGKKSPEERKSWLDHFLDFVFPNSKSDADDDDGEEQIYRRRKRDTANPRFLKKFLKFFINSFEKSSGFLSDAKDVLRYKMLKEFLPYLFQKRNKPTDSGAASNYENVMKMSHRKFSKILRRNDVENDVSNMSPRSKRSTADHFGKDGENRLWQAHSRRHRPQNQRSHDECSLRKACNAGRLLSRLPSVQEITLQLR